jgi:hypothetical protein
VEKVADDESGEAPLPREQGWIAPALMFSDEGSGVQKTGLREGVADGVDLEDRLDSFFGEEIEEVVQGVTTMINEVHGTLPPGETAATGFQAPGFEAESSPAPAMEESFREQTQDIIDGGLYPQVPAEAGSEDLGVVFEPVGDDVAVDELPVFQGVTGTDGLSVEEREFLGRLRECLDSMLEKQHYADMPSFLDEANRLILIWQTQYVKMSFLQLLVSVCQYIDRVGTDTETLDLLKSFGESLDLVFQGKIPTGEGKEQMIFAEMVRVLCWQQGLVLSVLNKKGSSETDDAEVQIMNGLKDFFGEK